MKLKRQSKIIELIRNQSIETQEELGRALKDSGFPVTQATISRDIKELGLIKVQTTKGTQKYSLFSGTASHISDKLMRVFCDGVVSVDFAQNIIIIRTLEGMAGAVASALDAMNHDNIIGTIAGDNTIFCITKSEEQAILVVNGLNSVIK